jgi:hypothetical protein
MEPLAKVAKEQRSRSSTIDDNVSKPGLLQRFFDFYAVYFGVTPPPPSRQKLMLGLLIGFFVVLVGVLLLVAKLVG